MMIKDVLIGIGIAWLSLTPEGKNMRKRAEQYIVERYILPKEEPKQEEVKDNAAQS